MSEETIETILGGKRQAADDFDENISRLKRQRTEDVSPYLGVVKRRGHLQILKEFCPAPVAQMLVDKVQRPVLQKIVAIIQGLKQEYSYTILDRIVKNTIFSLPALAEFEELERAMVANRAEKLSANFHFFVLHSTENLVCEIPLKIKVARYQGTYSLS